jgi:hypothetical protein
MQNNGSAVGVTATSHSSGALWAIQGDAIRNIYGTVDFYNSPLQGPIDSPSGVFTASNMNKYDLRSSSPFAGNLYSVLDLSVANGHL